MLAQDLAARTGQPELQPEHVLSALLQQEGGLVVPILKKVGATSRTEAVYRATRAYR